MGNGTFQNFLITAGVPPWLAVVVVCFGILLIALVRTIRQISQMPPDLAKEIIGYLERRRIWRQRRRRSRSEEPKKLLSGREALRPRRRVPKRRSAHDRNRRRRRPGHG